MIRCILLLILFGCCCLHRIYGILLQSPSTHPIPGNSRREEDQDFKGRAGYIGVECMVMPLKMVVLLLSVHLLPFKCLFHLCHLHLTDLPKHLPQAPADDCFNQQGHKGHAPLVVSLVTNEAKPDVNSLVTGNLPFPCREDSHQVLPTVCCTPWGVTPGPCYRHVSSSIH